MAPGLPYAVHVVQRDLPPELANAGHARRLAMDEAARLVAPDGILVTTDADSVVSRGWLGCNLAELARGADAVAGMARIVPDDVAHLPQRVAREEALSERLKDLLDEIDWLVDPDPADPWPRHTQHSGASIAVRADVFRRVGGIPFVPVSEDRLFFSRLRKFDCRIRHARNADVLVSGRLEGRAEGGMADTLRRRALRPDLWLDDAIEPVSAHLRRARLRGLVRAAWACGLSAERAAEMEAMLKVPAGRWLLVENSCFFGVAWDALQAASPLLARRRVRTRALETEIANASAAVLALRNSGAVGDVSPSVRPLEAMLGF